MMYQQPFAPVSNPRANSAMIYGIISLVLGSLTVVTRVGFAGLITGSFAVFYGISSVIFANKYPHKPGRGQAIAGIIMGSIALLLVFIGFILEVATSTTSTF
jgi:hypothetical protein